VFLGNAHNLVHRVEAVICGEVSSHSPFHALVQSDRVTGSEALHAPAVCFGPPTDLEFQFFDIKSSTSNVHCILLVRL
jgi:hypothetical protein